ncbi:hypothetical protein F4780DRAFT_763324 [Xylariomycetidae sp. FL0641]|nr:hypothetical protein F4780DRAFT_763324 [Xylariomycetidae sp. FL0641]
MSTTPKSKSGSPVKEPPTPEEAEPEPEFDQSLMVEAPTQLEDPTEEVTVRLQPLDVDSNRMPAVSYGQERQRRARTPEPQKRTSNRSDLQSPGHLAPFDWEDFEDRYEKALQAADADEKQLLEEFDNLIKYFNAWASASSSHDNERAVKRLQTRERHVRISESKLSQKKKHLADVVSAFQSALALLNAT